ncbi:transglutaminase family protein [Ectothiorhodospiraceae bacterium BW-2]|nr:transglutaminase family protein [Ectothiorhodospiraceae bacterium BW-2]
MQYQIRHVTEYLYQGRVALCHNTARLIPRNSEHQRRLEASLQIDPPPAFSQRYSDYFGNVTTYFAVDQPHSRLQVTSHSRLEISHPGILPLPTHSPPWEEVRDAVAGCGDDALLHAHGYTFASPYVPLLPQLYDYASESFDLGRPLLDAVRELMQRIFNDFSYAPGFTTLVTPLQSVFEHRRGVCQDFAHLMIASLRVLGLPARYVSGYLETLPPPGEEKLQGSDASHAWISVYIPEMGWTDFDPTNNQIPTTQHLTIAWGRDYSDVAPLKGVIYGGGTHTLAVAVDVTRLGELE